MNKQTYQEQMIRLRHEVSMLDDTNRACIKEIENSIELADMIYKATESMMPNVYSVLGESGVVRSEEALTSLSKVKQNSSWMISKLGLITTECESIEILLDSGMDMPGEMLDAFAEVVIALRKNSEEIARRQSETTSRLKVDYVEMIILKELITC